MSKRRKYQDANERILPAPTSLDSSVMQGERIRPPAENRAPTPKRPVGSTKNAARWSPTALLPLRVLGSLTFGIVIMVILIVLLAWGTVIESDYGRKVARFALYGNRWFVVILGVLALNLAASMLVRLPWKRRHLPFLVAHSGLLVLLVGSFLTWSRGNEAQITLPEGSAGKTAIRMDRQSFTVRTVYQETGFRATESDVRIPFEPGPFSWEDYKRENRHRRGPQRFQDTLWLAMRWGHRDQGQLSLPKGVDGIKLEVLDYYAGSTTQPSPPLELSILWKKTVRTTTELGEEREFPRNWERIELDIRPRHHPGRTERYGAQAEMLGNEKIRFFMTASSTEVDAFRSSLPETGSEHGSWGSLVLHYGGRRVVVDVDRLLRETEGDRRFRLEGTSLEIGNVRFRGRVPLIHFTLFAPDGQRQFMTLNPEDYGSCVHASTFGVYGSYWVDPETLGREHPEQVDPSTVERLSTPKIDFLQGPDKRLYYRYWNGKTIVAHGTVASQDESKTVGKKPALTLAAGTPDEVDLVVERFFPQDLPGLRIISLPVGRDQGSVQRVKLRVTVDGSEETFWLRASHATVVPLPPEADQYFDVHGKNRTVRITWNYDSIDLGFGIFLKKFEKQTEPGTRMSSHYSSLVDFVDMSNVPSGFSRSQNDFRALKKDVLIKMNQPAVFQAVSGGKTMGRRYRIYQAKYQGPYHPGDLTFLELYDGKIFPWEETPRESIYMSTLSINDDPGRGLKYLGGFLLVFGTSWFFLRRNSVLRD